MEQAIHDAINSMTKAELTHGLKQVQAAIEILKGVHGGTEVFEQSLVAMQQRLEEVS